MEEINLNEFFEYYKKYFFVVAIAMFIFASSILVYNICFKVPKYSTYTTLVLVKNENISKEVTTSESIDQNDITLNQKLVSTYRQIIKSKLVLVQTIENLKLDYTYKKLYDEVAVTSEENTEILKITVTDESPERATEIANEIATVFDKEVKKIYNISNVSVIDKAEVNVVPANINIIRDFILALLCGFVFGSAVIFIIFYFDDTLREVDSIETDIKLPVIGKIYKDNNKIDAVVSERPNSLASESIRTLRTNLQFASIDEELKTILVTSSIPGEGKSFISANLAISFAEAGKKTLVVDCDLRKGRLHKIFNVDGSKGLSSLLIGEVSKYKKFIQPTDNKNLFVLPRGIYPPNPSELLNSKKNSKLIETLKDNYDIIIFDGAPVMGLSDSLIISSLVDKVLLVASLNEAQRTEIKNTKKDLENIDAHIAGVVVNNINARKSKHSGYYYYYSSESDK